MNSDDVTERIIGSGFAVSNALGAGFLEKVYENACYLELQKRGLSVRQQAQLPVYYHGVEVGFYIADLIVEDQVIVEIKAAKGIDKAHEAQLLNYLKATNMRTGLILNFGTPRLGIRRMVL